MPVTGTVEVWSTPWDDAEGALLHEIGVARNSLRVEVLADREVVAKGSNSLVPQLATAGIAVRLKTRVAAAHNTILLIDVEGDAPVVTTGSYNYTFSAQARHAENLPILRGDLPLARAYLANWRRHRDEALPYAEARLP